MVLITPRIRADASALHEGTLEISFPEDSGCETFAVPLHPDEDLLEKWQMWVLSIEYTEVGGTENARG